LTDGPSGHFLSLDSDFEGTTQQPGSQCSLFRDCQLALVIFHEGLSPVALSQQCDSPEREEVEMVLLQM